MTWQLKISREDNGYILEGRFGDNDIPSKVVIEDKDNDELDSREKLLWEVMYYFNLGGSKHDKERIRIIRELRDSYEEGSADTDELEDWELNQEDLKSTGLDNHIEEDGSRGSRSNE